MVPAEEALSHYPSVRLQPPKRTRTHLLTVTGPLPTATPQVTAQVQAPPIAGVLQLGAGLKAQRKAPSLPKVDCPTAQRRRAPKGLLACCKA